MRLAGVLQGRLDTLENDVGNHSNHKVSRCIVEVSAQNLGGAPNDGQGIGGPMDVEALCDQLDQRRADLR